MKVLPSQGVGLNSIERYSLFPLCVVTKSGLFTIDLSRRRVGRGSFVAERLRFSSWWKRWLNLFSLVRHPLPVSKSDHLSSLSTHTPCRTVRVNLEPSGFFSPSLFPSPAVFLVLIFTFWIHHWRFVSLRFLLVIPQREDLCASAVPAVMRRQVMSESSR